MKVWEVIVKLEINVRVSSAVRSGECDLLNGKLVCFVFQYN